MKNHKKFLFLIFFFVINFAILPFFVRAEGMLDSQIGFNNASDQGDIAPAFGYDSGDKPDVRDLVVNIINVFLGFLGLLFVVLIMWGGFKWMTSRGKEDEISRAKSIISSGIIGFVIIMTSLFIANMVNYYVTQEVLEGVVF